MMTIIMLTIGFFAVRHYYHSWEDGQIARLPAHIQDAIRRRR